MGFEQEYNALVQDVVQYGHRRGTRNGFTRSLFATTLQIDSLASGQFPLLTQRRIYYPGVFGELAAFVRGATTVGEFKKWGCNYWAPNARAWKLNEGVENDDNLVVGQVYGAQWVNWEQTGFNQLTALVNGLKSDPFGRRHIITSFSPTAVSCLPPCHLMAQFYVNEEGLLDCQVYMRSVDLILGLPSDIVLYAALLIAVAKDAGYAPGYLEFAMGDTHVYENHVELWETQQLRRQCYELPYFESSSDIAVQAFVPGDIIITDYNHAGPIRYDLSV